MIKSKFNTCNIGGGIVVKNYQGYFVRSHPDFLKDFSHNEHVFIVGMQTSHEFVDQINYLFDKLDETMGIIKKQSKQIEELKIENKKLKKSD
ncbi:hypothetical protein [Methanobacterium aggregans]|uniref:hypothetical protein n=1 Tax=Methanobacterium aggregans TaxID=1615586 RepID=UPI001AE96428|nr:hypothetical protein [Methanobacterium aggregans]MBP2045189.1 hypothetical protein [Methanobacterium aggregans]